MISVRPAIADDLDAAADTLAQAYADYTWLRWTVAADRHVDRIRGLQRLWLESVGLPLGEVWIAMADDALVAAVAVWTHPHTVIPPETLLAMAPRIAGLEADRHEYAAMAAVLEATLRPKTPHYYLGSVGALPSLHRRGIGSAVLAPVLARADAEAVDAYLETSSAENVAFYRQLGFGVTGELDVPDGGPHLWGMLRRPRH